jgi:hypothetical protein
MAGTVELGQNYALVNLFKYAAKVETKEGKVYYKFPFWFEQLPGNFEVVMHRDMPEDLSNFICKAGLGSNNPQIEQPEV